MPLKKSLIISLFILAGLFQSVLAQETSKGDSIKRFNIVDSLYTKGAKGYYQDFRSSVRFPRESYTARHEGLLIYEISVSENGEVSVRFMTKMDEAIEQEVSKFILLSANNWINIGRAYKVYQPISFGTGKYFVGQIMGMTGGFPATFKDPFVQVLSLTTIKGPTVRSTKTFVVNKSEGEIPEEVIRKLREEQARKDPNGVLNRSRIGSPGQIPGQTLQFYNKLVEKLEKHLAKDKLKKAYLTINEVIRLNPFDKSLIQQRRRLEKQLGKDEYRVYDILWLQAMDQLKSIY